MKSSTYRKILVNFFLAIIFYPSQSNSSENDSSSNYKDRLLGVYSANCKSRAKPIVTLASNNFEIQTKDQLLTLSELDAYLNYFGQEDPGKEFQLAFTGFTEDDVFVAFLVYEDESGMYGLFDLAASSVDPIDLESMQIKYYKCPLGK